VTVSLALHWLDRPQFYGQVRRVLKPNGIVAAWCYGVLRVSPEVDTIVDRIYSEILDKYWFPERRAIEDQYRSMDFPFEEVQPPSFSLSRTWSLEEVAGHIKTWSASQRYRSENHRDPVDLVGAELAAAWGDPNLKKQVRWTFFMRVGKVRSSSPRSSGSARERN